MGALDKLRTGLPAGLRVVRPPLLPPPENRDTAQLHLQRPLAPEAQAALYVHWPYCEKRCSYCNFNKYIPRNLDEQRMRNCLIQEAQTLIQLSGTHRITSVFFGGGTPSLANPLTIGAVLDTISQCAYLAEGTEVTLEANPTSADSSCLAKFQKAGVNRLSIGIQSLNDTELKLLGRNHTACDALRTLEEAKKLFPGHTSIDLIFGLPGQTTASWVQGLEESLAVCDDHISLYQLTLERGTSLFKQVHQGFLPMLDLDVVSEMYEHARHILQNSGFHQYEVSNFARNGALSTHNLSYWQGNQYIGIGPGAHGRFVPLGDGKIHREARIQTLEPDVWMKEVLAFGHGTRKQTELGKLDVLEEVLMLGLRTDTGITHQGGTTREQALLLVDTSLNSDDGGGNQNRAPSDGLDASEHWLQFAPNFSLWDVFGESEEVKDLEEHSLLLLDNRRKLSWEQQKICVLYPDGTFPFLWFDAGEYSCEGESAFPSWIPPALKSRKPAMLLWK